MRCYVASMYLFVWSALLYFALVFQAKDDVRYAHYFKMLVVGVPEPAVRNKMMVEGVDPSILDDPEAPAPP